MLLSNSEIRLHYIPRPCMQATSERPGNRGCPHGGSPPLARTSSSSPPLRRHMRSHTTRPATAALSPPPATRPTSTRSPRSLSHRPSPPWPRPAAMPTCPRPRCGRCWTVARQRPGARAALRRRWRPSRHRSRHSRRPSRCSGRFGTWPCKGRGYARSRRPARGHRPVGVLPPVRRTPSARRRTRPRQACMRRRGEPARARVSSQTLAARFGVRCRGAPWRHAAAAARHGCQRGSRDCSHRWAAPRRPAGRCPIA